MSKKLEAGAGELIKVKFKKLEERKELEGYSSGGTIFYKEYCAEVNLADKTLILRSGCRAWKRANFTYFSLSDNVTCVVDNKAIVAITKIKK